MRAVKSENTKPELFVRYLLHNLGYRYRLYRKDLPGKPDLTFAGRRRVIFVHGCFWHGHDCKRGARIPKQNRDYWENKVIRNKRRDMMNLDALQQLSWRALVVWECELGDSAALRNKLVSFLDGD
jgi:DNA mismatch endonuclease (patch repair protein)